MKRKISAFFMATLSVILLSFVLAGCSSSNQKYEKLSSKFDEKNVKSTAESIVTLINSGDYQKVTTTMAGEDIKKGMTADELKKAVSPVLSKAGNFNSFGSETVTGVINTKTNQEFAMVIITGKYKKQDVQYTITFGTDMKLEGFYLK